VVQIQIRIFGVLDPDPQFDPDAKFFHDFYHVKILWHCLF
jgi:hypothetical protein